MMGWVVGTTKGVMRTMGFTRSTSKTKGETTNKWRQCEQSGKAHDKKDVKNYMKNNKKEGQMRAKAWTTLVTMEITKTLWVVYARKEN